MYSQDDLKKIDILTSKWITVLYVHAFLIFHSDLDSFHPHFQNFIGGGKWISVTLSQFNDLWMPKLDDSQMKQYRKMQFRRAPGVLQPQCRI